MGGTLLVAAGTAALCCYGYWESSVHRRNLAKIPIRIHVNGTRGKSGVTRLIAAGLRAGGVRTFAKATGTMPRAIFPDGREYPIYRPGRTNVNEQMRVIHAAAAENAEALVIECMALQPSLQAICELKFVQSTHGVITNARADHLDVMGPTVPDVARALAATTPVAGKLYTTETDRANLDIFRHAAIDRHTAFIPLGDDEVSQVSWDEMQKFDYVEHPENVALALHVCAELGIQRHTALRGMWKATPDAGVMKAYRARHAGQPLMFVNGFAANDPDSTGMIWHMMCRRCAQFSRRVALVNCRADRPERSAQIAEAAVRWESADQYVVVGTATEVFVRRAVEAGLDRRRINVVAEPNVRAIVDAVSHPRASTFVMGMGNIAGPGLALVDYFEGRRDHEFAAAAAPTASLEAA